ncbi:hypothetical protein GCM10017786_61400 [Amycolatopsis deserti]|uniref:Chorismate-utilising enzyme C-terminal domain-containing protein n=1 Tax=Amycolatopsis deserti TaxID=185696 RepID=A0ABQ3JCK8_9PSEU|nr:aminodeoxychorismate synthase component I [Amycolatopsis deserti]GHF19326.1 hypothetical protein GCM10017786_61400 [Amycolatopsis deserti]
MLAEVERATARGGWAYGYLGYEAAAAFGLPVHPPDPDGPPLAWFGLSLPPERLPGLGAPASPYRALWTPAWSEADHHREVELVRDRIADGETYQTNLTVRMHGLLDCTPQTLYQHLARGQAGAHHAYLDLGRFVIASASPELFFERRRDHVVLRPMKGTAPRGRDPVEDHAHAAALRSSEKERAENVMIVDLMRNDIARVARPGSVRVPALLRVERYPTVLQLTSDVTAELEPGTGLVELFGALFPCGSVTGAPKRSSMDLIRRLEPTPRGVYCGAIGWVAPPGAPVRARFNVAIRTAVADRRTGTAVYGAGGGITWGSDPAAEHREVLAKTAILLPRREPVSGGPGSRRGS